MKVKLISNRGNKEFNTNAKNVKAAISKFLHSDNGSMAVSENEDIEAYVTENEEDGSFYFCTIYVNENSRLKFVYEN